MSCWKKCNFFYFYKTLNLLRNLHFFSAEENPQKISLPFLVHSLLFPHSLCLRKLTCVDLITRAPDPLYPAGFDELKLWGKLEGGEESGLVVVSPWALSLSAAERYPATCVPRSKLTALKWLALSHCVLWWDTSLGACSLAVTFLTS